MYSVPTIFDDNLFKSIFEDFSQLSKCSRFSFDDSFPPLNLYMNSDDKACTFELALTGYKKDWLSLELEGRILKISADVPESNDEDSKKYFKHRIQAKSFEKVYKIPEGYDAEKAEVTYEDGLLTVFIPVKEKPEETVKKLSIR